MENIVVSVHIVTYNHEKYIAECLDGIVNQVCDFDYEILIGDDASQDATQLIINEYKEKFSDKKIIPFLGKTNIGPFQNHLRLFKASHGKYIAICEGDDYWIDKYKLQKQVDALEANPDCVACHSWQKISVFDDNTKCYIEKEAPKEGHGYFPKEISNVGEIFKNNLRPKVRTIMFHNIFKTNPFPIWYTKVKFGDEALNFTLGKYGKFYFIDEEMSVYRLNITGLSSVFRNNKGYINGTKAWLFEYDTAAQHYESAYDKEALIGMSFFIKRMFKQNWFGFTNASKFIMWLLFASNLRLKIRFKLYFLVVSFMFSKKSIL